MMKNRPNYFLEPETRKEIEAWEEKKQKRRAQGRANKAVGDSFELWVEGQHEAALKMGLLAHVTHHEPHAKKIRGAWIFVKAGVADYGGTLINGICLASEAKSTSSDHLDLKEVKPAQQQHLWANAIAGGLSFLLVEFRHGGVKNRFACPWLDTPWKTLRSAESVAECDLVRWKIEPGTCYLSKYVKPNTEIAARIRAASVPRGRIFPRE